MLALGEWGWCWPHVVWRAVSITTMQQLRAMAGIPRTPRSWRSCQAWVLLQEGGHWGYLSLVSGNAAVGWASRADLDIRCALRRAVHLHLQRYCEQMRELCGKEGLACDMRRRRIGRLAGRWEDALVAAWCQNCDDKGRGPNAVVDVVANRTVVG